MFFLLFNLLIGVSHESKLDSLNFSGKDQWFSEDKFKHFAHSAAISSSIYLIANKVAKTNKKESFYLSFSTTTLLGISKEIKDSKTEGEKASQKDFVFDLAGVLFGIFLVSLGGT